MDPCSALSRYRGTTAMWGNRGCSPKFTEQARLERRDSHITQAIMVARVAMIEKGCNGIFRKRVYNMSIEGHEVDHEDGNWLEDERNPPIYTLGALSAWCMVPIQAMPRCRNERTPTLGIGMQVPIGPSCDFT